MTVAALCEANSISQRDRLKPGAEILVALHHNGSDAGSAPLLTAKAAPVQQRAESHIEIQNEPVEIASESRPGIIRASYSPPAARISPSSYEVRRGDTLYSISNRFHLSVAEIKRLNHLRSNAVKPGESLRVAELDKPIARR